MNFDFMSKMDAFSDKYYETNKNSGALRITLKDEIIYEKFMGYSNSASKLPFTRDSLFTFYSMTKPFCAMGLLKLKDKGLVDINSHPSRYVPEALGFDSRVTIKQMLNHISGLPDFVQTAGFDKKYDSAKSHQMRGYLKELVSYPMVFEPGTDAMYANVNYIIAALIIENVSGISYDEYMKKDVFEPLGMKTAMIDKPEIDFENRVNGHELKNGEVTPVTLTKDWMFGAGDVIGTLDDVYCLNNAIKHKLLLKPETWDEILTPSPLNSMGLGCTISNWHGKKRITHNGGSEGFRTLHIQLPEDDFDIIYMSNSGWGDARNDFAEAVYRAYYGDDCHEGEKVGMDVGYI